MAQEQRKIAEVLHDLGMDPQLIALMTGSESDIDEGDSPMADS